MQVVNMVPTFKSLNIPICSALCVNNQYCGLHSSLLPICLGLCLKWIPCGVLNVQFGEKSRFAWPVVEADPLLQSDELLKKAYNRPSQDVNGSTQKSLISKNATVSGLGLLGIKQGNVDSVERETRAPKVRRQRIVRKN